MDDEFRSAYNFHLWWRHGELTEEGSRSLDFTAVGSTTPATKEWRVFH